jgi:hypothetical protein
MSYRNSDTKLNGVSVAHKQEARTTAMFAFFSPES